MEGQTEETDAFLKLNAERRRRLLALRDREAVQGCRLVRAWKREVGEECRVWQRGHPGVQRRVGDEDQRS